MAALPSLFAPDRSTTHLDAFPSFACLFSHQPRGRRHHVSTAGRHGRRPHPIPFTVRCSAAGGTRSDDLLRPFERLARRDVVLGGLGCLAGLGLTSTPAHGSPIADPELYACVSTAVGGHTNRHLKALSEWCAPFLDSAVQFSPPTSGTTNLKLRPAAHRVDEAYIEKFERAIQLMKELPVEDPRNFHQQANVLRAHTQVASSWLFLAWHRIYLYFYERILGKLVGDENFAIPFWNWDHPEGMPMPAMYTNPPSPLVPSHLAAAPLFPDNTNLYFTKILNGNKSRKPFDEGDMGNFYSAGRDAMVYALHADVDRMWDVWRKKIARHSKDDEPEWLNPTFYFYDENKQLVRVKVSDALDPERLGYTYVTAQDLLWVNDPAPTRKNFQTSEEMKAKAARTAAVFPVVLSSAVSTIVKRPRTSRSKKEKDEEEEVLVVRDIEVESGVFAKFDVFVNAPDYEGLTASAGELAGSFTSLPRFTPLKTNLRLGLSGQLEIIGADGDDEIVVTLVPRAAQGKVKIGGVGIEYIKNS